MENPPPICAHCGQPVGDVWTVTKPSAYVICGEGACERWVHAQGEWSWTDSGRWRPPWTPPAPTTRMPRRTPRPAPVPTEPYLPSPEVIENARSVRGGWSLATLAAWGVPWPPPEGWRADLERRWRESHVT